MICDKYLVLEAIDAVNFRYVRHRKVSTLMSEKRIISLGMHAKCQVFII